MTPMIKLSGEGGAGAARVSGRGWAAGREVGGAAWHT